MFRFYAHDIWWLNSPWYDRYGCSPYDIYIPVALSRIDKQGKTQAPSLLNILSVDNARGDLPDICANEIMPYLLKAEKDAPDEAAPVVLVYPFREYTFADNETMLKEMYFGDLFLQDAVNNGFLVAQAVSAENFVLHPSEIYNKSVLLVPALTGNSIADEKLAEYAQNGGKIITYGSLEALNIVKYRLERAIIEEGTKSLFTALKKFGYHIEFASDNGCRLPSLTVHRSDNAMFFSVYNRDTTVETRLKFPLGAPILDGFSTKLTDGYASYRFGKCTHSECRVFVKQNSGIVTVNAKYRRRIQISGLENAELSVFGEKDCKDRRIITTCGELETPVFMAGWEFVSDSENGTNLHRKNISGSIFLCMP